MGVFTPTPHFIADVIGGELKYYNGKVHDSDGVLFTISTDNNFYCYSMYIIRYSESGPSDVSSLQIRDELDNMKIELESFNTDAFTYHYSVSFPFPLVLPDGWDVYANSLVNGRGYGVLMVGYQD